MIYSSIPSLRKRSLFNLGHTHLTSMKMGFLVPVMMQECLPGDTWQGDTKLFLRMAPLMAPVMHRLNITISTFYVPTRLLWDDFQNFITGGEDGMDDSVPPTVSIVPTVGSLADHFGLPLTDSEIAVSALPFRAMSLIWNSRYRDQDLQDPLEFSTASGPDTITSTDLLRAAWGKDYFTTARPSPQKGPQLTIPISGLDGDLGVTSDGIMKFSLGNEAARASATSGASVSMSTSSRNSGIGFYGIGVSDTSGSGHTSDAAIQQAHLASAPSLDPSNNNFSWFDPNFSTQATGRFSAISTRPLTYASGLKLNIGPDNSVGLDLNLLREFQAMQIAAERRSLFGSRYEDLLHYWNLPTQDSRLNLPEVISNHNSLVQFSEVLQTSQSLTGQETGVGSMAGHGVGASRSGRWRYFCYEHGYIMTLLCVRPQTVYTQGIERMWTRSTRYDYWNPEYQHIGQRPVLSKEVYADGTDADDQVFGYQNQFDEYRRAKNYVSGEFKTTLDFWHMARQFANRPSLNGEFITSDPTDRIFQLSESLGDQLYVMVNNDILCKRLVDRQGNPM